MRKEAETEVPIMPPTREKVLNLVEMASAVPATAMQIIITMLYMYFFRACGEPVDGERVSDVGE